MVSYRYGFQGQEKDDEIKGSGNSLNYKFRMYDSRVCRFFAVDPLTWKFPFYSPYHFSSNSPVVAIELEGLESSFRLNYTEGSVEVVDGHVKYTGGLENIPPSNWGHGSAGGTSTPKEGEIINVICTDCVNSKTGLKGTRIWIRVGVTKVIKAETVEDEVPREIKGTHGTNDRIDTDYVTESKGVQYVNGSGEPTKIKDSEVPFTTERQKSRNDAFTDFINQKLEAKSPNEVRSLVSVILVAQENTLYNSSVKRRIEALYGVIVDVNVDGDAMKSYTDKFGFCTQVIYPKIQIQTTTKGSPGTPARTEMVKVSKTVYEEVSPIEIIE